MCLKWEFSKSSPLMNGQYMYNQIHLYVNMFGRNYFIADVNTKISLSTAVVEVINKHIFHLIFHVFVVSMASKRQRIYFHIYFNQSLINNIISKLIALFSVQFVSQLYVSYIMYIIFIICFIFRVNKIMLFFRIR